MQPTRSWLTPKQIARSRDQYSARAGLADAEGEANASSRPPRTVASVCAAARLRDPCVCSGDLGRNHPLLAIGLHWEDETWYLFCFPRVGYCFYGFRHTYRPLDGTCAHSCSLWRVISSLLRTDFRFCLLGRSTMAAEARCANRCLTVRPLSTRAGARSFLLYGTLSRLVQALSGEDWSHSLFFRRQT